MINEKTDIWSLGITLYELLVLEKPFIDETVQKIIDKILKSEPILLRRSDKKIPAELEAIVFKCLEKNPDGRYKTASELSQDLNNYLELKPTKAKPIRFIERIKKAIKRKPMMAFVILLACLFLFYGSAQTFCRFLIYRWNYADELSEMGKHQESLNIYMCYQDLQPQSFQLNLQIPCS